MRVLAAVLDRAQKKGWIAVNPMEDVEVIERPEPDPDFDVLEPHEVEAVARAVAAIPAEDLPRMRNGKVDRHALAMMRQSRPMWALAILLLAYTGRRFGELRALRWRDVDFAGRVIHVRRNASSSIPARSRRRAKRPKGRRGRSHPLIDQVVEVLRRIQAAGYPGGQDDLVVPTSGVGMLQVGRVRDAFYRGLRQAGLSHLRDKGHGRRTKKTARPDGGATLARLLPLSSQKGHRATPRADVRREPRQVSDDMATRRGDDAQVRVDYETRGYGSSATWASSQHSGGADDEASATTPATRPAVELARYATTGGSERIVRVQRIRGVVRLTDVPADPHGRRYLIERGLTSRAGLDAIVADYLQQAAAMDAVPAAWTVLHEETG
jgi:integrase